MISFQELRQKYYSDPKSGIRNEEAPTNSTGPAIANPDIPLNIKKKKKDIPLKDNLENVSTATCKSEKK